MTRFVRYLPALVWLVFAGAAWAADEVVVAGPTDWTWLQSLGVPGVIAAFAYQVGRGVRITVQVELSERDRAIIEQLGEQAAERGARR